MKRVIGLAAFCYMVLGVGNVSYVEAAKPFNQLRTEELEKNSKVQEYLELKEDPTVQEYREMKKDPKIQEYLEIKKDPKVQEYIKLKKKELEKKEKSSDNRKKRRNEEVDSETEGENSGVQESIRNEELESPTESENYASQTTKKKKRKRRNKKQSVQNVADNSSAYGESDNQTMIENQNSNQTTGNKKKKRKKKNKSNQMNQMGQINQTNMMNQNQANQMNQMGQMNMMNQNQVNQMGQSGQTNSKKRKKKNKKNKNQANQSGQMSNVNSDEVFVLNEPVIDGSKIKKSSMIVEKDIKLADNKETKKAEKNIDTINLSPLDKKAVLAHIDSAKDVKLVANSDNHDLKIKEKLRQASNDRKTYNLIRTPDKTLKDDIRVNKFRAELNHYRKLYSANSKTA